MPQKKWTEGEQEAFLHSKIESYLDHKGRSQLTLFWNSIYAEWFDKYPAELAVFPRSKIPDLNVGTPLEVRAKKLPLVKQRIKDWFIHRTKVKPNAPGGQEVAPVVESERKEYLDSLPKGVKPECELTFKNRILIQMYDHESDAVKAECEAYRRSLVAIGSSAKAAKQKYEESRVQLNLDQVDEDKDTSGQLSPETERLLLLAERQRKIKLLPASLGPILRGVFRETKYRAVLLLGGREPVRGGEISTIVMSSGTTADSGLTFEQFHPNWEKDVEDWFVKWARKACAGDEDVSQPIEQTDAQSAEPTTSETTSTQEEPARSTAEPIHGQTVPASASQSEAQSPSPSSNSGTLVEQVDHDMATAFDDPAVMEQSPPDVEPMVERRTEAVGEGTGMDVDDARQGHAQVADGASLSSATGLAHSSNNAPASPAPPGIGANPDGSTLVLERWHDDARDFMTKHIPFANAITVIDGWIHVEQLLGPPPSNKARLDLSDRPEAVKWWYKNARTYARLPPREKTTNQGNLTISWYVSLNPTWRGTSWPLLQDNERANTEDWEKLAISGNKGLVGLLMCFAWWGATVDTVEERRRIVEVLGDLSWVLKWMATRLKEKLSSSSSKTTTTRPKMKRGAGPHLDVPAPKRRNRNKKA